MIPLREKPSHWSSQPRPFGVRPEQAVPPSSCSGSLSTQGRPGCLLWSLPPSPLSWTHATTYKPASLPLPSLPQTSFSLKRTSQQTSPQLAVPPASLGVTLSMQPLPRLAGCTVLSHPCLLSSTSWQEAEPQTHRVPAKLWASDIPSAGTSPPSDLRPCSSSKSRLQCHLLRDLRSPAATPAPPPPHHPPSSSPERSLVPELSPLTIY